MVLSRGRAAVAIVTGAAALLLLFRFPAPLFPYSIAGAHLDLRSDRPLPDAAARGVLALAEAKLAASPLFTPSRRHAVFICNNRWLRRVFFATSPGARGVNQMDSRTFLSAADFEKHELVSPSGEPDVFGRKLEHFVAHEVAHALSREAVGIVAFERLDDWAKEGYAEYVAFGQPWDYGAACRAFLDDAPEMNRPPIAPYLRYRFLVGHLLEKRGWNVPALLRNGMTRAQAQAMVTGDLARPEACPTARAR